MSGQISNFDNDPYTFQERADKGSGKNKIIRYKNPVANFYEREAPEFVEELKATRFPKAPIGTTPFQPSMGAGVLKEDTTGPKPGLAIGSQEAQASDWIITPIGESGKNTFIQICVDVSGSMGAGAGTYQGLPMHRTDVARACVAVMLAQAKAGGDHFALYAFNTRGYVEWPGPSQNYDEAINWLTSIDSDAFHWRGGTQQRAGLQIMIDGCRSGIPNERGETEPIDRAVTILLTDEKFDFDRECWHTRDRISGKPLDSVLRDMGPVYYVGIGSESQADWFVPAYGGKKIDKTTGKTKYFGGTMAKAAESHYKGADMAPYFMFCCLEEDRDDGLMHLCGTFAQMCRMTQEDNY